MDATRRARLASLIQEELSVVVPREVKDPRIPSVTFTAVEVSPDGSQAKVRVAILGAGLGDEAVAKKSMRAALDGLSSASGFLRRHLAGVMSVKHVPTLLFEEDKGLQNTMRVHELLKQISSEGSGGEPSGGKS